MEEAKEGKVQSKYSQSNLKIVNREEEYKKKDWENWQNNDIYSALARAG